MASMQTFVFKRVDTINLNLDVYTTESTTYEKPLVLFFHSGGLVSYNRKAIAPHIVQACLIRGWPLVSADYRLLPQVTTEELLEDVCDAYRFVDEQLWSRLGVTSERAGREMKGRIIVAGASAPAFLAFLAATHVTPTPLAILDIYGVPTFQSSFFHSNTTYPAAPIHHSQLAHHLNGPITTGSTPLSEAFTLDMLSKDYSKNPKYQLPLLEGGVGDEIDAKVTEQGLKLLERSDLYDYFVQEGFYAKSFERIERAQAISRKEFPKTVIVHGNADVDVPVDLSVDFAEKHGFDKVQLFIAKGKPHFYDGELFLGDPELKEFEEAWKVLDVIVRSG